MRKVPGGWRIFEIGKQLPLTSLLTEGEANFHLQELAGMAAADLVSKQEAHYRSSINPAKRCGKCSMERGSSPISRTCTKVEGNVNDNDVCMYFAPKT